MNTLGLALLVGGIALLCSGLIFLLPAAKPVPPQNSFEESQRDLELHLRELRRLHEDERSHG